MGASQERREETSKPAWARDSLAKEYSKHGRFKPGERPPYPSIHEALNIESTQLRLAAVAELESAGDGDSLLLLRSAAWDWFLPVRVLAVEALERMGDTSVKEAFIALANGDDFEPKFDALRLLAQLRDKSLLPIFRDAMESDDPRISTLAADAAFSLGDRSGLASLVSKLNSGTEAERIEAAGFLVAIEDVEAEAAVDGFLRSGNVPPSVKEKISSSMDRARRRKN
jgi:HEAT repeat protein